MFGPKCEANESAPGSSSGEATWSSSVGGMTPSAGRGVLAPSAGKDPMSPPARPPLMGSPAPRGKVSTREERNIQIHSVVTVLAGEESRLVYAACRDVWYHRY